MPTATGERLPSSRILPGPTARTLPRCGFCFAVSGSRIPPVVCSSASSASTTTRSSSGRIATLPSSFFAIGEYLLGSSLVGRVESSRPAIGSERRASLDPPCVWLHHPAHAAHSHVAHATHAAHAAHATAVVVVVMVVGLLLL